MSADNSHLDEHIERLRGGDTLTEKEVKALCDKVSQSNVQRPWHARLRLHAARQGPTRPTRIFPVRSSFANFYVKASVTRLYCL